MVSAGIVGRNKYILTYTYCYADLLSALYIVDDGITPLQDLINICNTQETDRSSVL